MNLKLDKLTESNAFLNFLFSELTSAVLVVDENYKIVNLNDSGKTIFGCSEEVLGKLCGNGLGCAFAVNEQVVCGETSQCSKCTLRNQLKQSFTGTDGIYRDVITREFFINNEPVVKHLQFTVKPLQYQGKQLSVIVIEDVSALEEQKAKLKELAEKDYLTQLYNRRYFMDVAGKFYSNARRENLTLALAMLDIDHFKSINDTWGHEAGDFALKHVADIFRGALREADLLARIGGEEFTILLAGVDLQQAAEVMEKIRTLIECSELRVDGKLIKMSISIGLTTELFDSIDDMLADADQLLYNAKNGGRNRVCTHLTV